MWTIIVLIFNSRTTSDAVTCDVRFTAKGGPYDKAFLEKQFVYTHPTSTTDIIGHLTNYASMLKVSFSASPSLKNMTWEV